MSETNVLILGNGFDLAHHLPTSYATVMQVLKKINEHSGNEATFQELFNFMDDTGVKSMYDTDRMRFDLSSFKDSDILDNPWFDYFSAHLSIETWIDFENEIEHALEAVIELNENICLTLSEKLEIQHYLYGSKVGADDAGGIFLKKSAHKPLERLRIFEVRMSRNYQTGELKPTGEFLIRDRFCVDRDDSNYCLGGFKVTETLDYLSNELQRFIKLFDLYFIQVIQNFYEMQRTNIEIQLPMNLFVDEHELNIGQEKELIVFAKVLSFNYTPTFENFYAHMLGNASVEYIHGRSSSKQNRQNNIVLGVNDIADGLKIHKAFSFTKYYQKLINQTDCLFLSTWIEAIKKNERLPFETVNEAGKLTDDSGKLYALKPAHFYIWGHSLDSSDAVYIRQLFEFLELMPDSRLTVFHHNKNSCGRLLDNLLKIMGQEVIENVMLKKRLVFRSTENISLAVPKTELIEKDTEVA